MLGVSTALGPRIAYVSYRTTPILYLKREKRYFSSIFNSPIVECVCQYIPTSHPMKTMGEKRKFIITRQSTSCPKLPSTETVSLNTKFKSISPSNTHKNDIRTTVNCWYPASATDIHRSRTLTCCYSCDTEQCVNFMKHNILKTQDFI